MAESESAQMLLSFTVAVRIEATVITTNLWILNYVVWKFEVHQELCER